MSKISYKPLEEEVKADEILDLVFKDSAVKHGLQCRKGDCPLILFVRPITYIGAVAFPGD